MMGKKQIGLDVELPSQKCVDPHCAFHGTISLRGRQFVGFVKKVSGHRTVVVEWLRLFYIPKYQRYEKRKSKILVHKPDCLDINVGDKVVIVETRPISKTKNFCAIKKI